MLYYRLLFLLPTILLFDIMSFKMRASEPGEVVVVIGQEGGDSQSGLEAEDGSEYEGNTYSYDLVDQETGKKYILQATIYYDAIYLYIQRNCSAEGLPLHEAGYIPLERTCSLQDNDRNRIADLGTMQAACVMAERVFIDQGRCWSDYWGFDEAIQ